MKTRQETLQRQMQRKRTLNIGCWNIQGLSTKINLDSQLEKCGMDIIVLSETKKKGCGEETLGNYLHFWSGVDKGTRAKAGVSILISKSLKSKIKNWKFINEKILLLELVIFGRELVVVGTYAPTNDSSVIEKDKYWNTLRDVLEEIPRRKEILIMGDLNARTGIQQHSKIVGQFGESIKNDNGDRLIDICEQFELRINNGFFEHKKIHKYTWTQKKKGWQSIIDYIISKQNGTTKLIDVKVLRGAECGTDHYLVRGKIYFQWTNKNIVEHNRKDSSNNLQILQDSKFKISLFCDESIKMLYEQRMSKEIDTTFEGTTEELYDYMVNVIKKVSYEVLGIENKKSQLNTWINQDIEKKIEEKRQAYQRWLNTGTEDDRKIYTEEKYTVLKEVRRAKNEQWEKVCSEVNCQLGFKQSVAAWKVLTGMRKNLNTKTNIPLIPTNQWVEYYRNLLNEERPEFKEDDTFTHKKLNWEVSDEEVKYFLSIGKNGKATGPGGIHLEMLKYGGPKLTTLLTKLYNKILVGEEIPKDMKLGYISSIHKKGDRKICQNYRGICVMNPFIKTFSRIIKHRIEQQYRNSEEQAGFTAGKSCVDHIFTLKILLEKCREKFKEIGLVFIDLEKAYDSVPRKLLWQALRQASISQDIIDILKSIYSNNRCQIKIGNRLSQEFGTTKGLLQGCCLSPILFKIYIDVILRDWSRKCNVMGIPMKSQYFLYHLLFADDQVLITQDIEDASYMTRKLV